MSVPHLRHVAVICKHAMAWRDYHRKFVPDTLMETPSEWHGSDTIYYLFSIAALDKLRSVKVDKVILYNVELDKDQMLMLMFRFKDRPTFEEIVDPTSSA